jgi:16S rRNA (guanine527-N7)-methyltransferase
MRPKLSQICNPQSTIWDSMDPARIAELLQPFLAAPTLIPTQLTQISDYLDLLLRWNARINLTAVREAEYIVTRHFGESLFAARHLLPTNQQRPAARLIDVGSGAGFPGLPIKLWAPQLQLMLIESNQKKASFLREVVRKLSLQAADVFCGRAEDFPDQAEVVAQRAVERFDSALPIAARLVAPGGRLALLVGEAQVARALELVPDLDWEEPRPIPLSSRRVLLIAHCQAGAGI